MAWERRAGARSASGREKARVLVGMDKQAVAEV